METSYKEKYEQALERCRKLYNEAKANEYTSDIEDYETIFPELKESEDEKIRKMLISFVKNWDKGGIVSKYTSDANDIWQILAWLEKQGEQKSLTIDIKSMVDSYEQRLIKNGGVSNSPLVNMCVAAFKHGVENTLDELHLKQIPANSAKTCKDEPKFKVGDWIIDIQGVSANQIIGYEDDSYHIKTSCSKFYLPMKLAEKNYRLWTIQDAKKGDVLYCKNAGFEYIVVNKCINNQNNVDSYFMYDSLDGFDVGVPDVLSVEDDKITPATKEQRDILFQKMKEAGYEWDADKKELKKIEQKPEENKGNIGGISPNWSEEDEVKINRIVACLENLNVADNDILLKDVDWLKSLKQRIEG